MVFQINSLKGKNWASTTYYWHMHIYRKENICLCENDARTILQQYFVLLSMWIIYNLLMTFKRRTIYRRFRTMRNERYFEASRLLKLAVCYISESAYLIYMCRIISPFFMTQNLAPQLTLPKKNYKRNSNNFYTVFFVMQNCTTCRCCRYIAYIHTEYEINQHCRIKIMPDY